MPHLNWRGSRHSLARPAAGASERRQRLALSSLDSRLPVSLALICGVMFALSIMLLPANAFGLGERVVSRDCGTNKIGSVSFGHYSQAWTTKNSGSCAGRLSVAMQFSNGYRTPRVYGSNLHAATTVLGSAQKGVHWGCDQCRLSYT